MLDVAIDGRLLKTRELEEHDPESVGFVLHAMEQTCVLDVVDDYGSCTQMEAARFLNIDQGLISRIEAAGKERAKSYRP